MNAKLLQFAPPRARVITLFFMLTSTILWAQGEEYHRDSDGSGKGYWSLYTDHNTRSTIIKFFNPEDELLYQEILPGQYVKLTTRNTRAINDAFTKYMKHTLVASEVRASMMTNTSAFSLDEQEFYPPATVDLSTYAYAPAEGTSSLRAIAFPLINPNRFRLMFDNPSGKYAMVSIRNARGQVLHSHTVDKPEYDRTFDFSRKQPGVYTLSVMANGQEFIRFIDVSESEGKRSLRIYPPASQAESKVMPLTRREKK
jgi:hypothetical protein